MKILQDPEDSNDKVSTCRICDLKFHRANECPNKYSSRLFDKKETIFFEEPTDSVLAETMVIVITDSG